MIKEGGRRQLLPAGSTDTTRMLLSRQREKFEAAVFAAAANSGCGRESKMKGLSGFAARGALL